MGEILYKELSYKVVGAAMEVHRIMGSGYLEAVYQAALDHELKLRGVSAKREQPLPVNYKNVEVGYYIADFVVEDKIILELKVVKKLIPRHKAQAINYLTTTGYKLGLLLNFGGTSLESQRVIR